MGSRWIARLGRTAAYCALALAAWALAQGSPAPEAGSDEAAATPANRAPVLAVFPDGVSVRAGDRATVIVEALDPDVAADGATEAVWLNAAMAPHPDGTQPGWLTETTWSAAPSERPRLDLTFAPPVNAPAGVYTVEAGATDARGLSTLAAFEVTVLPPRCGALEVDEDGVCVRCPENRLPDASRTVCEPCPAGTEQVEGTVSCGTCPPGMTSDPGESCGCGEARLLADGACIDCPPHTESAGDACMACPPDTERPAGTPMCTDCPAGETSPGGAACAPPAALKAAAPQTGASGGLTAKSSTAADTTAPTIVAAGYAGTTVTLTLSEPVWAEMRPGADNFVIRSNVVFTVTGIDIASRQADASETITLTLAQAPAGSARVQLSYVDSGTVSARPRDAAGNRMGFHTVTVHPRRTLRVSFDGVTDAGIAEDAGEVGVTLALDNPPDAGSYTGCRIRLAADSVAEAADVELAATEQTLDAGGGWRATGAKLLNIVDDAYAEGDEQLAVEAYCTGGAANVDPPAAELVSEPATVAIADNESRTIVLTAMPAEIVETAGVTQVTVTATLDGQATAKLELPLALSGTATADDYTVTGTRSVAIEAGATTGSTVLTVTPTADEDDTDETIAIGSALTGYAVMGETVTITEPVAPTIVATADVATLSEAAGDVKVRLTLQHPPASGAYTHCRLRLGAGSEAETPADVTFPKVTKLVAEKGWTARTKLMRVVDDALDEGDEALVIEGHCTGTKPGTEPGPGALVSKPLRLTIKDNDDAARALTLSVDPDTIGETLGAQAVDVTATVTEAPPSPVTVSLSLGSGAYTVTGTQSVTVPADATSGTTTLAFTPGDDGNTSDDTLSIGGTASGYTVTGTDLTITEPATVGGVDLSGLSVELTVSPTAIREGTSGTHRVRAKLVGVDVPAVDVSMLLGTGGTATQGGSHDYTLTGAAGWDRLTVTANDAHLSDDTEVTVSALADNADEGEETVTFAVSQVTWGTTVVALNDPAVATLRITEAWDTPRSPKGLAAVQAPGNETHGLDVTWKSVTATPPVDGYVVRYRAVTDPPAAWTDADIQPGLATALTALNAGTRYEIRVFARNAAGDGAESGSVFVYTADGGCPMAAPTVTTPQGARSYSDLNVSWQAPACGASLSGYRVRYREDADVENVENDWTEIAAAGTSATLTGLTADTAYVIAVRAVAVGGDQGPWSPEGKGRTGLDTRLPPRLGAPTVAPHSVDGASRLEATWTRVTWTDDKDVVHPITEYQYRYRPKGGAWTAETGAQATSAETATMTRSISGLPVGTWHEVQVRAVNRMSGIAYPGKWSEPGRGRTWGAPDRVEEPSAYLTGSAVEVVWDEPHDGGSRITDYDVEYKVQDAGGWDPHTYAGCSMGTCATETSINAVVKKVRVRAENALGMGEWSPAAGVQQRKLLRVSYGASSATVTEGESLLVTVRLDSAADRAVSAPVTKTGDATAFRIDGLTSDAAAFGLGTREQTFTFVAVQDEDDADEKITLGFGTLPDGVRLTAPASLVVTIRDDETANGRPSFAAGAAAVRTVAENAAAGTNVGAPLSATDPEDDALAYTLGGTHAALFTVDGSNGQLEVGSGTDLDFEGAVMSYAVSVEVSDGKDGAGKADTAVDATVAVTVNVTDVAEPPGTPDTPTLTPTESTLAVAWTAPDNTGPAVTGYDVHYRASGAADWTDAQFAGTGTATTLGGLSAGTAHEVRVRATSDEGTGDWSAPAAENTLPAVSLTAGARKPEIADGNAAVEVTLSASTNAAGGTLKGAWLERDGEGTVTVLADGIALTDGTAVTRAVSSSVPGARTFGFRATHTLDGRTRTSTEWMTVDWRPQVILSAAPASVAEDGGATKITVTATLTGTVLTDAAKTVTVSVAGGTAKAGDDFAAVENFTIGVPGKTRSADGSFTLTPVVDSDREGPETVSVTGTATDGSPVTVVAAAVSIVDADPKLTVTAPTNGYVTGTTGSGDATKTVIDCGSGSRTDCSETLAGGTVVTLTATAEAKYLFDGWTGVCTGTAACTVTLNADSTVGTTFVAARSLTVTAPSHGKVTGRIGTKTVIDCGSDCSETVADGTRVALSASAGSGYKFGSWGGACTTETSADCSLTLNADRRVSVAFVSTAVVGKCDESVVDGCEPGTLNNTAFGDTKANHHWRCDGSGGGANSRKCTKAKPGCASGSQGWNVGNNACRGSVTGGTSGQTRTASDGDGAATGSASFECDDGIWLEQSGSVCGLECAEDADRTWNDGSDNCSAPLPKTPHLGTRTVTDSVYSGTGSATYKCNDGTWEGPSSSTCRSGCAEQTRSHCDLTNTVDGGSSGECDDDSTGSCSYSCSDGVWSWESGRCNARCPTGPETWDVGNDSCTDTLTGGAHGTTRAAQDYAGSARGAASYRCSNGDWLEQPGSTCARECEGADKTWNECTGSLKTKPSGQTDTADDDDYPDTGSATYSCSDGTWEGPSGASCYASCAADTIDGCNVSNTVHDGDSGTCESGADACLYECNDGNWEKKSNTCPVDCDASTETWTVGDDSCSAGLAGGEHGSSQAVKDEDDAVDSTLGSATYKCEYGKWLEQSGSSCGRKCEPSAVSWKDGTDKCEATLPRSSHMGGATVEDRTYSATGSATYSCNDGKWIGPTAETCYKGCEGTEAGCKLPNTVHEDPASGTCQSPHTGSCSYSCSDGKWTPTTTCTAPRTVTVSPAPKNGTVTGPGDLSCPDTCSTMVSDGSVVTLTATPDADYECKSWTVSGGDSVNCTNSATCSFVANNNVTASVACRLKLKAIAGGPYDVVHVRLPTFPIPIGTSLYTASVTATAKGGVPPYSFQWSKNTIAGATVVYVWPVLALVPSTVSVTVTDDDKPTKGKNTAKATLTLPSADAVQGASDDAVAFEVPLGGDLQFIWGGDGTVSAKPEHSTVVSVSASSPVITVTGTGVGKTHVIVTTEDGEWWLPVVVR